MTLRPTSPPTSLTLAYLTGELQTHEGSSAFSKDRRGKLAYTAEEFVTGAARYHRSCNDQQALLFCDRSTGEIECLTAAGMPPWVANDCKSRGKQQERLMTTRARLQAKLNARNSPK